MPHLTQFHHASSRSALAQALALFVGERLQAGLSQRGQALLVVSGGSTPVPFLEALAQIELDWSRVTVTLADERWLAPEHVDSNERLVRTHLLHGRAQAAQFVPLYREALSPESAHKQLESDLAGLPWPADAVVLGMGGDGHTASLFPHAPELSRGLSQSHTDRCIAVGIPAPPNVPVARISLTRHALLDTRALIIHITGGDKWALLQQALLAGPEADLPIRLALHQQLAPCDVFHAD